MRRGFVTAGTWCVDRNITVDAWPAEDMLGIVSHVEPAGGGCACNFAVDMRRLDQTIPVETQGLVGQDDMGDFLLEIADSNGIDRTGVHRTSEAQTQVTDAYRSAKTGRRTHILFYGTAPLLTPNHFDFTRTTARILHMGLPGIHATMDNPWGEDANGWVTVLKKARTSGLETNLEFVSAAPEVLRRIALPCLPYLTTLVVNDHEIGAIAGMPTVIDGVTDMSAVQIAAQQVLTMGAMEVVVVHFTLGAVLVSRSGSVIVQPSVDIPDSERVGANGAGDAFAAGFFYGRHEGWTDQACLRLGHATAAACLRAADTYSSVEDAQTCLSLAGRWGWRKFD